MEKEKFNNGKDIMLEDIFIEYLEEYNIYRAYLGFTSFNKINTKFYVATGETKEEAITSLLHVMIMHLERLKS